MRIRVKNFEALGGLWWRKTFEKEGWVGVQLVGVDEDKHRRYEDALQALMKITLIPRHILIEAIVAHCPMNDDFWLKVYLRGVVRKDQVEEDK